MCAAGFTQTATHYVKYTAPLSINRHRVLRRTHNQPSETLDTNTMSNTETADDLLYDAPTTTTLNNIDVRQHNATLGDGRYTTTITEILETVYKHALEQNARIPVTPTVRTHADGTSCNVYITVFSPNPMPVFNLDTLENTLPDDAALDTTRVESNGHTEHAELVNWAATHSQTNAEELPPELVEKSKHALTEYHTDTRQHYKTTYNILVTPNTPHHQ